MGWIRTLSPSPSPVTSTISNHCISAGFRRRCLGGVLILLSGTIADILFKVLYRIVCRAEHHDGAFPSLEQKRHTRVSSHKFAVSHTCRLRTSANSSLARNPSETATRPKAISKRSHACEWSARRWPRTLSPCLCITKFLKTEQVAAKAQPAPYLPRLELEKIDSIAAGISAKCLRKLYTFGGEKAIHSGRARYLACLEQSNTTPV